MNVADAIVKCALNMSLVTGQGMSPYSDDQVQNYLLNAHQMIIEKWVWPELVVTAFRVLDASTGRFTVAFSAADGLVSYRQIKHIYLDSVYRELPLVSGAVNPLIQTFSYGYTPTNIIEDPNRQYIIKVIPPTTSGNAAVVYQLQADFTDPNTVIPIDDLLHVWIATWMWAEDDATNPGQAEKYLNLWQDRVKDIRSNVNTGPYALNPFNGPNQTWWESGYPA